LNAQETLGGEVGVRLFPIGLTLGELDLQGGVVFWDEVARFSEQADLADLLTHIRKDSTPPRIWVFLDTPERTGTRTAAALAVARALWHRGRKVLVLDGDDRRPDLTRWAGCFQREGWIDCVRYGASLGACGVPLPWEGQPGRLLGVGSFCPTGATAEELQQLVARLRLQADDLIITAPLNDLGKLWMAEADVRLLCWDRTSRSQTATEALLAGLAARGDVVDGLIGFGPSTRDWPEPVPETTRPSAEALSPAAAATAPGGRTAEHARPAADSQPPPPVLAVRNREQRSSRIFWGLAAVLLLLILLVGSWWFGAMRRQEPEHRAASEPPRIAERSAATLPTPATAEPVFDQQSRPSGEPQAEGAPAGSRPTEPAPASPFLREDATGAVEQESAAATVDSNAAAGAAIPDSSAITGAALTLDPYQPPVGQDGWVLHLYSVADSATAGKEVAALQQQGIRAEWRAVTVPDRGLWYRIYVGSFPSREAALQAKPALLQRLGTDWAMPKRYRR
jgi:cell division septation protein DedD